MKLQVFLLLVSVALLQLSQTCSGQSGEDPTGIQPGTTGGIDYDMDDMFTTTTEEPNLCIGAGSGSGSGDLMGSGCPSTTLGPSVETTLPPTDPPTDPPTTCKFYQYIHVPNINIVVNTPLAICSSMHICYEYES